MRVAFLLLLACLPLGLIDGVYVHHYKLRLFQRPEAAEENVTHAIRSLLLTVLLVFVLHVHLSGSWWWAWPALLAAEVLNTLADLYCEGTLRPSYGGLPLLEYISHVIGYGAMGAAFACVLWGSVGNLAEPTAITFQTLDLHWGLVLAGNVIIAVGVAGGVFEATAAARGFAARRRARRPQRVDAGTGAS